MTKANCTVTNWVRACGRPIAERDACVEVRALFMPENTITIDLSRPRASDPEGTAESMTIRVSLDGARRMRDEIDDFIAQAEAKAGSKAGA